jgi:hypothetical protein
MRPELKRDVVYAVLVSLLMSAVMAFFMPLVNMGWQANFAAIWWAGFVVGMVISFPLSLLVIPLLHKLVTEAFLKER